MELACLFLAVFPFIPLYVFKLISLKSSSKALPVIKIIDVERVTSDLNTYDRELGKECPIQKKEKINEISNQIFERSASLKTFSEAKKEMINE